MNNIIYRVVILGLAGERNVSRMWHSRGIRRFEGLNCEKAPTPHHNFDGDHNVG